MVDSVSRNIQYYDPYKMEARLVQEKIEEYHLVAIAMMRHWLFLDINLGIKIVV